MCWCFSFILPIHSHHTDGKKKLTRCIHTNIYTQYGLLRVNDLKKFCSLLQDDDFTLKTTKKSTNRIVLQTALYAHLTLYIFDFFESESCKGSLIFNAVMILSKLITLSVATLSRIYIINLL